ncbi:MAG: HPF/RaiA family ribosome-associated protein [Gluconacetobacter diazotrophicus]|nr:HPF/RaiA family ribosome-associated protein [Gluconacetobacter diazotrophicus]
MRLMVAGRKVELPEGLRTRVARHLGTIAARYLDGGDGGDVPEADVTFARGRAFVSCDIDMRGACGLLLHGEGEGNDPTAAFDDAAEHIARRLRRYRRRVGDHARSLAGRARAETGRHYLLRREDDRATGADGDRPRATATVIGREAVEIATLTVSEAMMRLDLADGSLLMFRNSLSGGINVVYRREDGLVGWLDPEVAVTA